MADEDGIEAFVNSRNYPRTDDKDDNRRRSSRDGDRHRGQRDSDRSRNDSDKHKRRRSRSRSGSRERTSSRSGRERSRREERRRSDDDEDEGAYGSSQKGESGDYEEEKFQVRRDRRDDDRPNGDRITGHDWRCKLTSIRDAHFNRNKQAPVLVKNQFKNDGSFLEMFKKRMAEQAAKGEDKQSVTPNSLVLASSSIPFSAHLSLPPLTLVPASSTDVSQTSGGIDPDEDVDGVPMPTHKPLPVPVSVGKRRLAKPLKTGIVAKKPQEPEEDEASQEKLDALSRYLQEVQKYKAANCVDEDNSRPLVK
ncbi:unnamed protein product [Candidula unifasciata]|uniref:Uncharacterized protein n=1 Tax=Candidula unifasciata TaxID=100452 RepID=A0A8S3YMC5_9EUPU|nr:unnamed protein product [Candidula unifasciata]